jgi:hypothetical protein
MTNRKFMVSLAARRPSTGDTSRMKTRPQPAESGPDRNFTPIGNSTGRSFGTEPPTKLGAVTGIGAQ